MRVLLGLALAPALLAGCGGPDEKPPGSAEIRAAQSAASFPLYWAGQSVAGLRLSDIARSDGRTTFIYGTCKASSDAGCATPAEIQTTSICERHALVFDSAPPAQRRRVRGVIARSDEREATVEIATGTSAVTVFARDDVRESVFAALQPIEGTLRAERLRQPRYPLAYVEELRRVRDAYRRLGIAGGTRSAGHLAARGPLSIAAGRGAGGCASAPPRVGVRREAVRGGAGAMRRGPANRPDEVA